MISLRDYAKHRGVSAPTVSRAVRTKRLLRSVVYASNGDPKIADVALADQEWEANTDLSRAPAEVKERGLGVQTSAPVPPADGESPPVPSTADGPAPASVDGKELSLSEASAEEKRWKAQIAKQQFLQRAGELVDIRDVTHRWAHLATTARTKLLAVPSKVKSRRPSLNHDDIATIDEEIRQALEELADALVNTAGAA